MSSPDVRGATGRIPLGKLLGKGAEGAVYEVIGRTDAAAKIYLKPASAERSAKLVAMQSMLTPVLGQLTAWPIEVLRDRDGHVCGFLMANLRNSKDIHRLYSPRS
jgi:DNA-binding helix-hairpin-helix protein with protein kinase domain